MNDIINDDILEFEFSEEDFIIYLEKDRWIARHNDESLFDEEIVIEDLKNGIKLKEDIELFNNYILTKDHFEILKSYS